MILCALLLSAQAAAPAAQAGADVIKLRNGSEIKGKVTTAGSKSVSYTDAAGKAGSQKTEDVQDVILGDLPPSYKKAEAAAAEGNHVKALNLWPLALEEVNAGKGRAALHKPYVLYGWALSVQGRDNAESLRILKRLRTECGDCRHRPISFQKSLEIARGSGEGLDAVLEEMKAEGGPAGIQAELELAKRAFAKSDYDAASAVFERHAAGTGPVAEEARLWQIRTLRMKKKPEDLEALAARVLADKASSPALVQAAASSLGRGQLAKAGKDLAKAREALMTLVLAASQGPPSSRDDVEDYAQALLGAAKCYALLAAATDKAETKEDYVGRAISYCREVQRAYRGTPWAVSAEDTLVELGAQEKKASPEKDK